MEIKTESKTTIEATGRLKDGCFSIRQESFYDGQEERFDTINFNGAIKKLEIPNGEYKLTITLEKIQP